MRWLMWLSCVHLTAVTKEKGFVCRTKVRPTLKKGEIIMKKAFTLIELLVVVLIIGILAAIALPQYQKAVVKSRFAETFTNLQTIAHAQQVCQLERAGEDCALEELSVDIGLPCVTNDDYYCPSSEVGRVTDNFLYMSSGMGGGELATSLYLKEDVCLCYMKDGSFGLNLNDGCGPAETTLNYSKLLQVDEKEGCSCC